jgi:TonB family protein
MNPGLGLENIFARTDSSLGSRIHRPPKLLLELEPWGRSFLHNLGDILLRRRPPAGTTTSAPAPFWHDVFVPRRMPWGAFAESILYHCVVLAVAWGWSALLPNHRQVAQPRRFDPADVIYYSPSEYLPPLDTGASHAARPLKGEPEYAKQAILSVPPEADNRHQTIVTPPNIKLNQDVQTPNIVAWGDRTVPVPIAATERRPTPLPALPNQIVAPAPDVEHSSRRTASLSQSIVAPPPDLHAGPVRAVASLAIDVVAPVPDATAAGTRRTLNAPQSSVVEPPPVVNAASVRKLGDINIGRSDVIAPAPQLAVPAQRTLGTLGGSGKAVVPPPPSLDAAGNGSTGTASARGAQHAAALAQGGAQVVPPPPSMQGTHSSPGGGRLIALGIHPSVAPPPDPPQGNRRGTFAASPEGKPGAAGTPDIRGDSSGTDGHGLGGNRNGTGTGPGGASDAPAGLHVGAPPRPATSTTAGDPTGKTGAGGGSGSPNGTLMAAVPPKSGAPVPAASHGPHGPKAELIDNPTPLDLQVFAGRPAYSMTLNMPNLNSAGGSWVIRFAELEGGNAEKGDLIAPVAEHKVDPAYPMELMRDNVSGTVTLRAIIRTDGSVGDIKVVNGADKRLDRYAAQALSRWHFFPAERNGTPVDVEAIVMIPFKPILRRPF